MAKPSAPLTEPEARARLAAGQPVPLEWIWILRGADWKPVNETKPGKTLEVEIRTSDAKPDRQSR